MMIDTHAHLSGLLERDINPHELLGRLFQNDFTGIIDISLKPGDLSSRIKEFSSYNRIRFASGLWPWPASIANRKEMLDKLEKDLLNNIEAKNKDENKNNLVCALGEFGLDHNWNGEGKEGSADLNGERELMEMQMDLAQRLKLPVIIHSRDAAKETADVLSRFPGVRGIVHCFSYGPDAAKVFLNMGYYISFAGNISYKNTQTILDSCAFVPLDRLFLETDCPYLAPVPFRGKASHPGMVEEVYKKTAEIRRIDMEALSEHIIENVKELFGINFNTISGG